MAKAIHRELSCTKYLMSVHRKLSVAPLRQFVSLGTAFHLKLSPTANAFVSRAELIHLIGGCRVQVRNVLAIVYCSTTITLQIMLLRNDSRRHCTQRVFNRKPQSGLELHGFKKRVPENTVLAEYLLENLKAV